MYSTTDKIITYTLLGVLVAWSLWGMTNYPYRPSEVNYMQCYGDDGTGPYTKDCGDMEVKCYDTTNYKKDGYNKRVDCPFSENLH